ncbi:MAG: hypothetical protein KY397_04720 [Gemmatimonadetes bacterium]|nr:hypothetical protein [Gemmatimonadota bacterium]
MQHRGAVRSDLGGTVDPPLHVDAERGAERLGHRRQHAEELQRRTCPPRSDSTAATIRSIAAASIVAKVARDRLLADAAGRWPQYGFESHKGYMTPQHVAALREHGLCPIHRLSFPRVWEEADAMGPVYRKLMERLTTAETSAELEAAEFAFDAARPSLHPSEEKLLQRVLETRRNAVAELAVDS